MIRDQSLMISGQPVHHPIQSSDVRIVEGAVHLFGSFLAPASPTVPVQVVIVEVRRKLVGLIVEKTLAHSVLFLAIAVLQMAPEHSVDELLNLREFLLVRLTELFHYERQP